MSYVLLYSYAFLVMYLERIKCNTIHTMHTVSAVHLFLGNQGIFDILWLYQEKLRSFVILLVFLERSNKNFAFVVASICRKKNPVT